MEIGCLRVCVSILATTPKPVNQVSSNFHGACGPHEGFWAESYLATPHPAVITGQKRGQKWRLRTGGLELSHIPYFSSFLSLLGYLAAAEAIS